MTTRYRMPWLTVTLPRVGIDIDQPQARDGVSIDSQNAASEGS